MANWCSNRVEFIGEDKALQEVHEFFVTMQNAEETTGNGQLPDFMETESGYFFSLYRNEGDVGVFEYETRWSPNTDVLKVIADRFGVGFTHEYKETGNCIYGVIEYKDGDETETDLDFEDFDRYEYNEDDGLYYFEGDTYESDYEILEILLERKLHTQNITL
ncbi:MAG: hypothetical protein ACLGH8_14705 [Bacteroidia bacterium]